MPCRTRIGVEASRLVEPQASSSRRQLCPQVRVGMCRCHCGRRSPRSTGGTTDDRSILGCRRHRYGSPTARRFADCPRRIGDGRRGGVVPVRRSVVDVVVDGDECVSVQRVRRGPGADASVRRAVRDARGDGERRVVHRAAPRGGVDHDQPPRRLRRDDTGTDTRTGGRTNRRFRTDHCIDCRWSTRRRSPSRRHHEPATTTTTRLTTIAPSGATAGTGRTSVVTSAGKLGATSGAATATTPGRVTGSTLGAEPTSRLRRRAAAWDGRRQLPVGSPAEPSASAAEVCWRLRAQYNSPTTMTSGPATIRISSQPPWWAMSAATGAITRRGRGWPVPGRRGPCSHRRRSALRQRRGGTSLSSPRAGSRTSPPR